MHRWTAHTWHGLYNLPTCQAFLQENLPREGLRLSFILHGIMALAALDAALLAPREDHALVRRYKRAALEYYTRASAEFRDVMKSAVVTRDTLYLLSMFGNIAGFFNLAISDDDNNGSGDGFAAKSAIDRVHDSFVMFLGSIHTAAMNWTWFFGGATSARLAVEEYYPRLEYMELIDVDTMAAIQRLSTVCRAIRLRPTGDPALDSDGQGPISYDVWSYRIAVGQTKYCFAEHVVGRIKGFMVNLPTRCVCGPEIADGLRTREPMAMFILLYWGVLLHGCAGDPWLWWAGTIGRDVVVETSEILARSPAFELEDVREGIAWARKQVGLEAMAQVAG
ncbi:survival factor 1 [Purpureocillium lavendulum]|uniref:Survival factor 1 n=1 Tax=Purpureocillium lavendulum TaxID=1247861 RepID=A0AB34FZS4_9HYPO|nr:survival factor 1 [Purpureocillium lavendulum]